MKKNNARELINVEFTCPMCGRKHYLKNISLEKFLKYQNGEGHVQDIFPELSAEDREKLITGYCRRCQNLIFGTSNED